MSKCEKANKAPISSPKVEQLTALKRVFSFFAGFEDFGRGSALKSALQASQNDVSCKCNAPLHRMHYLLCREQKQLQRS